MVSWYLNANKVLQCSQWDSSLLCYSIFSDITLVIERYKARSAHFSQKKVIFQSLTVNSACAISLSVLQHSTFKYNRGINKDVCIRRVSRSGGRFFFVSFWIVARDEIKRMHLKDAWRSQEEECNYGSPLEGVQHEKKGKAKRAAPQWAKRTAPPYSWSCVAKHRSQGR